MIDRVMAMLVAASAVFVGVSAAELLLDEPERSDREPLSKPRQAEPTPAPPEPKIDQLAAAALRAPLFSPTRRPPEQARGKPAQDEPDLRLAATIIEPGHRIAIFAVPGAKPLVLSEGEGLNGWRVESILPHAVSLSGPWGTRTLEEKPDQALKRQPMFANGQPRQTPAAPARPAVAAHGEAAPPIAPMPPLISSGQGVRATPDSLPRP